MKRKLISSDQATPASRQLVNPCSDCPWSRESLNGWLGGNTSEDWIEMAHGETRIECHVHPNVQCAGAAIYRANVDKRTRDSSLCLRLPADRSAVFATPNEFKEHHAKMPKKPARATDSAVIQDAFNQVRDKLDEVSEPLRGQQYLDLLSELKTDIEMRAEATQQELEEEK